MDYFDSNFKDDQSNQDLPEDFGWDDMKGGIYEKMSKPKPSTRNKYWPLLLLIFAAGCGGWMTMKYLGQQDAEAVAFEKNEVKKSAPDAEGITSENLSQNNTATPENPTIAAAKENNTTVVAVAPALGEEPLTPEEEEPLTPEGEEPLATNGEIYAQNLNKSTKTITNAPTSSNNQPVANTKGMNNAVETASSLSEVAINKELVDKTQKESLTSSTRPLTESPSLPLTTFERLKSLKAGAIPSLDYSHDFAFVPQKQALKNRFKKYLSLSLAGSVTNWTAGDPKNVNHDYLSGFPGYSISPAISLNLKSQQAIQLAYTYTNIEELLDYDGSHAIQVNKEDEVVKEIINSLTGEVISRERKDVKVDGIRKIRERKYNRFTLQSLSLGYRYGKSLNSKSALSLYMGASYLFNLSSKGKRLNEDLDIITFNDDSPLFQKNQFGLSFGFSYDYQIGKQTTLFSQLLATKYVTNWEISGSNSATRPFIYGLQLGIRQRFIK